MRRCRAVDAGHAIDINPACSSLGTDFEAATLYHIQYGFAEGRSDDIV